MANGELSGGHKTLWRLHGVTHLLATSKKNDENSLHDIKFRFTHVDFSMKAADVKDLPNCCSRVRSHWFWCHLGHKIPQLVNLVAHEYGRLI